MTAATFIDKHNEVHLNLESGLDILNTDAIGDEGVRRLLDDQPAADAAADADATADAAADAAADAEPPLECTNSFTVTTDNAQVVLPYTLDLEVDVYATLSPSMSFTTTDEAQCPIDELTLYAAIADYP